MITSYAFTINARKLPLTSHYMSFVSDGSDYSTTESDYETESEDGTATEGGPGFRPLAIDDPAKEEKPVPLSKNSANRFFVFLLDREIDIHGRDMMELHESRVELTKDHVLFCRKTNLYNETFNYNSMNDVVWSYQILSSDLGRYVGHALCIDSASFNDAKDLLSREPVIESLNGNDLSNIPFYRWRHLKDHSLRKDKGRFGVPFLILSLDRTDDAVNGLREKTKMSHIQYLIQSERVIQAGPLHVATPTKDDPNSVAVGNLIICNAVNRMAAIQFAENDPCALAGLYETIRVHRYNEMDISGKFVTQDIYDNNMDEMKEAMEYWGYPVDEDQTPWINS